MTIKYLSTCESKNTQYRMHVCIEVDGENAGTVRLMTDEEFAKYALEKKFCPTGQQQEVTKP